MDDHIRKNNIYDTNVIYKPDDYEVEWIWEDGLSYYEEDRGINPDIVEALEGIVNSGEKLNGLQVQVLSAIVEDYLNELK